MRKLFVLFLFPSLIFAQSNYLKDKNIVWAAEIEQDWIIDNPSLETEWEDGITTLKLLRPEEYRWEWDSPYLADLVFEAVRKRQLEVFIDPQCRVPAKVVTSTYTMDSAEFTGETTDSLVLYPRNMITSTYDPETREQRVVAVSVSYPTLNRIRAWRLRQVIAYHAKSATWSTTVEAIAPLVNRESDKDTLDLRPWFWFRPDNKQQKLSSKNIIWAKRLMGKPPSTALLIAQPRMLKVIDGYQNPLEHQLRVLRTDMKKQFCGPGNEKPLSREERLGLLSQTDTVVTFDPETYEEKVMVVHNDFNVGDITHLRLMQTWYWDEKKHRLSICLDAVAPVINQTDSEGNFRFQRPLYYRRR